MPRIDTPNPIQITKPPVRNGSLKLQATGAVSSFEACRAAVESARDEWLIPLLARHIRRQLQQLEHVKRLGADVHLMHSNHWEHGAQEDISATSLKNKLPHPGV